MDGDVHQVRPHLRGVYDALSAVERCTVPVIAPVNGIASGDRAELALGCDVVLAAVSAQFVFAEPTMGLIPGYDIGPEVMGTGRATSR